MYMWCSAAMLFTCALVISRPVSKEGAECETWAVGTNSKILGGPDQTRNILGKENQQEAQSNPGSRPGRTYLRGAPRRWLFKYVQSYDCIIACMKKLPWVPVICHLCFIMIIPYLRVKLQCWLMFIFCRLKINNDYHEFILEFGTVTNSYKEQFAPYSFTVKKTFNIKILVGGWLNIKLKITENFLRYLL
jgi:hypothetical protein